VPLQFPFRKGVVTVVMSWGVSPVFSGIVSSVIFFCTRTLILRRENSQLFAWIFFPFLNGFTLFVILVQIFLKGIPTEELAWGPGQFPVVCCLFSALFFSQFQLSFQLFPPLFALAVSWIRLDLAAADLCLLCLSVCPQARRLGWLWSLVLPTVCVASLSPST
jgi:hypothetical protein